MARLTLLRTLAHAGGQEVDALCGDPSWASNPAAAEKWAAEVAGTHLFGRLHLDIEPHATDQWSANRTPLVLGYLQALSRTRGSGMAVDADIPYWFNTIPAPNGQTLDRAVMQRVDSVTLMSYRNTAAGVLQASQAEMANAAASHTPAYIGVNLGPPGPDGPTASFYGESADTVRKALTRIEAAGPQWSSYAGISLHDSDHLPQRRR
jgi:hypothetical protein